MIRFGIDILLASPPAWKKQRIGLVTNDAATTNQLVLSRKALLQDGFNLVKLFSPEHGIQTRGVDGAVIPDVHDAATGLPVTSLYNNRLKPSVADLEGIDLLLFDIPDVGCRFYTYLWTLTHIIEAAAIHHIPLVVLDRSNPVSGLMELAEGPMLNEMSCSSFIGRWEMPLRHSCTLGELALYFNKTKNINASLEVIRCEGWNRKMFHPAWSLPFVPTSPAIGSFESALLYPGFGLLEATNISEGRGTDKPFQMMGAPWMDHVAIAKKLDGEPVEVSTEIFMPMESKYAGEQCNGIWCEVKHYEDFQPVRFALKFIKLVKDMHPEHFIWKPYPTMVNPSGVNHLDLLLGTPNSEALFDLSYADFIQQTNGLVQINWGEVVEPFLLYK